MEIRSDKRFKLDPRTKILMILIGNVLLFSYGDNIYLHIATAYALFLVILLGKAKQAIKMALICIALYATTYLMGFMPKAINSLWGMMILPIIIFMPLFALGLLLFITTEISEIITALQKMKFPAVIITPLIVMFRFFPTLRLELQSVRDAMKLKGVRKNPVKILEHVYVPILFNCVKIGEDLNISGLTRGLGLHNTTTQTVKIKIGLLDVLSIIIMIALVLFRRGIIVLW